mgnify:CR=1 FL=1
MLDGRGKSTQIVNVGLKAKNIGMCVHNYGSFCVKNSLSECWDSRIWDLPMKLLLANWTFLQEQYAKSIKYGLSAYQGIFCIFKSSISWNRQPKISGVENNRIMLFSNFINLIFKCSVYKCSKLGIPSLIRKIWRS